MKPWQWAGMAVLGAYGLVSVGTGAAHALRPAQSQDFAPVYMAARLWRHGLDPYLERSADEWQQATGATEVPFAPIDRAYSTPYPPMALLVVAGFSGFEWPAARVFWLVVNLSLAVYVPWLIHRLWFRTLPGPLAAAWFALWLGGMGLRVGLGNGQHAVFWFAATLSALWLLTGSRPGWAGVPLALSFHKYSLAAVFVPYLVAHRWFRPLGTAALIVLVALGVFLVGVRDEPVEVVNSFVRELRWWYGQTAGGGLQGKGITDFYPVFGAVMSAQAATAAMYLLMAIATVAACWPVPAGRLVPRGIDVSAVLLLMLVATYHRVYDTVVLFLPLCALAAWSRGQAGWRRWAMTALVGLLVLIWYADPSSVYRRLVPVPLDQVPTATAYVLLDLTYRLVIAAAFVVVVILRYERTPTRTAVAAVAQS
jgi:hypothetical protein